ncbi:MAG: hypothetical protein ACHQJ6_06420 [Candidatus Berkiellales bacterium]
MSFREARDNLATSLMNIHQAKNTPKGVKKNLLTYIANVESSKTEKDIAYALKKLSKLKLETVNTAISEYKKAVKKTEKAPTPASSRLSSTSFSSSTEYSSRSKSTSSQSDEKSGRTPSIAYSYDHTQEQGPQVKPRISIPTGEEYAFSRWSTSSEEKPKGEKPKGEEPKGGEPKREKRKK